MTTNILNAYLRLSSAAFGCRQRLARAERWWVVLPTALCAIVLELVLAVVSIPFYILVSPAKVLERGFVFPTSATPDHRLHNYLLRRKFTLTTTIGAIGVFVAKIIGVAVLSFVIGVQPLLAAVQDWTFDTAGDYTYDTAKIEVTGGVARLKNLGSVTSGATTNSAFTTDATGWAYADWLQPGGTTASGTYQASGGNTGGYVDVALSMGKNKTLAGYWSQSFTTTVSSPDTATLNFDWKAITFTSPAVPTTYQLYAFVDAASGTPSLGTQVWSSGEITAATNWASITAVNIAASVPTAGTYYLKIAAYATTPNTTGSYAYTAGFDNVIVNWSKATVSYDTTKPTINPTVSLVPTFVRSWNSFTEVATKNGGEVYYQLSSDDGATWKYWNGTAWASATAADFNIATVVNTNIASFPTAANRIMWKAFPSSDGTQQVILDTVTIGYTDNDLPDILTLAASQQTDDGYVNATYSMQDDDSDPASLATYEYSLTGAFAGEQATMTAATSDPAHSGISSLTSSTAGTAHTFVWNAVADLGAVYQGTVYVRLRANDGVGNGAYATSAAFAVDGAVPVVANVAASQSAGSTNVAITYDLTDNTASGLLVEIDISQDSGATWTVTDTGVSGAVGASQTTGTGKTITWAAGTDFTGQQQSDIRVRVRARDNFQNQGTNTQSADFVLDTLAPATLATADLQAQPNAGDTTVSISGSFTEANPNTNDFSAALNGGAYGSSTAGTANTATPGATATAVGVTLDGNDVISKVKVVHTDDFGQATTNENTSPSTSFKYVKPYTPLTPTLSNPVTTRLDLLVNPNASEASDLEYAMQETTSGNYIQGDGTLGASAVWRTLGTSAGQWGDGLAVSGKVRVTGLTSPVANYIFKVKSRNPSDAAHATSSESAFSATAQITNTAPSIAFGTVAQTTDGTQYVNVNYAGTDGQGDIASLNISEYSDG